MKAPVRIAFAHRRIRQIDDITDLVAILFPNNRNQQHAAARILLALRDATGPVQTFSCLGSRYNVSRRTLERVRAKLSQLGLIEYVGWMNCRYGDGCGWKLSSRMGGALRRLADAVDALRANTPPERREKDAALVSLLSPAT
jgi:hypothetical protein